MEKVDRLFFAKLKALLTKDGEFLNNRPPQKSRQ